MYEASIAVTTPNGAIEALRAHWPEYLIEAAALGTFMLSACFFSVLLGYPDSAVYRAIPNQMIRTILIGAAMGLTAIGIIYSRWGQRSGAHMNPALTLTFFSLGKIAGWDVMFYVLAQFIGGLAGVLLSAALIGPALAHKSVKYAATVPGPGGPWVAFLCEFTISFLLMTTVLLVSNSPRLSKFTPLFGGFLVAGYISLESPFSGMSMNPARTFASALPAATWTAVWIYFTAPPLAMFLAGQLYKQWRGSHRVFCAKWHHHNDKRCIFRCNYGALHHDQ